jgi:hypothetical protein
MCCNWDFFLAMCEVKLLRVSYWLMELEFFWMLQLRFSHLHMICDSKNCSLFHSGLGVAYGFGSEIKSPYHTERKLLGKLLDNWWGKKKKEKKNVNARSTFARAQTRSLNWSVLMRGTVPSRCMEWETHSNHAAPPCPKSIHAVVQRRSTRDSWGALKSGRSRWCNQ